jgi:TPR repeat protein
MDSELTELLIKYKINLTDYDISIMSDIFINHNVDNYINDKKMFYPLGVYYQYHKKDYYKMLDFYSKDIVNGSNECLNNIMEHFRYTEDGKHDIHFTKYMKITKDCEDGDIPSIIMLTKHYEVMEAIKHKDMNELIEQYYLIAFRKGNVYSMRQLGIFYGSFKNKSLSKEEQIKLMKKFYLMAIKSGDGYSAYNLALYYNNKENGYYNEILIKTFCEIAFERGIYKAYDKLASFYQVSSNIEMQNNMTPEKRIDLMKKYYLLAIEKGESDSMFKLAYYYQNNKENGHYKYGLMKKYYKMAIEKNDSASMSNLGYYYQNNKENGHYKYGLMKKYYKMAIEKNNNEAMNNLGSYYKTNTENGNYKYGLMKKYYKMAIEKNNNEAMNNLGYYYETNTENGDYKYGLMKKYYKMAIKKCNTRAMTNLGEYYINIEKIPMIGIKYLEMGVNHNHCPAMNSLGTYYRDTQNIELMIKYYTLSCYQNDADGMYLLGDYYESIKDYENMEKYYKMAISRGDVRAKKQMDEYNAKLEKEMDDKFEIDLKALQIKLNIT